MSFAVSDMKVCGFTPKAVRFAAITLENSFVSATAGEPMLVKK